MKGFGWTQEARDLVRQHYGKLQPRKIAELVGRSASAVRNQAAAMGLPTGSYKAWTPKEEERLRTLYPRLGAIRTAIRLGRSEHGVTRRANELGLHGSRGPRWRKHVAADVQVSP